MLERLSRYAFFAFVALLPLQTVLFLREPIIDGSKWQYGTIGLHGTNILLLVALLLGLLRSFAPHRITFLPIRFLPVKLFDICISLRATKAQGHSHGLLFHPVSKAYIPKIFNGKKTNSQKIHLIKWSVASIVLLAGLSLFWSEDRMLAGYTFAKLALAFGLFVFVQSLSVKDIRRVLLLLLAGAFLESLLGIGQFLTQASFASKWLGMSSYDAWQAGVSVLKNDSGRWLRSYGTFPHPNIFGSYIGAVLLLLMGCLTFWKGRITERWSYWVHWTINVSLMALLLLGLLLSFSRSAWLGFGMGMGVLACVVFLQRDRETKKWFLQSALVLVLSATVFTSMLHEVIFPRFDGAIIQREAAVIDRAVLTRQAIEIIREHPWLGVGAGNYTLAVMQKYPSMPVWDAQPVHNVFLLIWAELGIFGLLAFVLLLLSVLSAGCRNLWRQDQKENAIFFIAFLSLFPSLLLDHFLWDSHSGLLFFFLLSGLAIRKA